jgi:hypothetical protein
MHEQRALKDILVEDLSTSMPNRPQPHRHHDELIICYFLHHIGNPTSGVIRLIMIQHVPDILTFQDPSASRHIAVK